MGRGRCRFQCASAHAHDSCGLCRGRFGQVGSESLWEVPVERGRKPALIIPRDCHLPKMISMPQGCGPGSCAYVPLHFRSERLPMKYDHVVTTLLMCGLFLATPCVRASECGIEYVTSLQTIEGRVISVRETSQGLIVFLQFTNRSDADEHAFYQINWLDTSGHDVKLDESVPAEPWRVIFVPTYEARSAEIISPTPLALNCRIQISVGKVFR